MNLITVQNVKHRLGNDYFYFFHPSLSAGATTGPVLFTSEEIIRARLRVDKAKGWELSRKLLPPEPEPKKQGFFEKVKRFKIFPKFMRGLNG